MAKDKPGEWHEGKTVPLPSSDKVLVPSPGCALNNKLGN